MARKPDSTRTHTPFHYRQLSAEEKTGYEASLNHFFDSLLNKAGFSGGILVAKNGQVLYEHYQGFSDNAKADSINAETPFHVASTSKTFTGTAVMQLVEQGKISLNDSLQSYFPGFPYGGMTVRNLMNHSSGLPNYANYLPAAKWDRKVNASNADVLSVLISSKPRLEFTTGTRFRYCNTNFALLALIVEKASSRKFPDYVRDSIFMRCGMADSYVVSTENPGDFMPSWTGGNRIYNFDYLDGIYGDKNVFTTCRDLLRYDSAIRENVLLKQDSYEEMWNPNFPDRHYRDTTEFYGLAWRLKVFNDSLYIPYHNGWWHGNNSCFQRLISDTAVIIVTGNRMNNRIYRAARAANIFRNYFGVITDVVAEEDQKDEPVRETVRKGTTKKAAVKAAPKKKAAVKSKVKTSTKKPAASKTKKKGKR